MFKYDVFISYSSKDSELALRIYSNLCDSEVRCFLAEKDISAGDRWEDRIRKALRSSEQILLLVTSSSMNSQWVIAEASAAWILNKRLIPAFTTTEVNDFITPLTSFQKKYIRNAEEISELVNELTQNRLVVDGDINGQWMDPSDGDVAYFRQSANNVVGFYNNADGDRKFGIYAGNLFNRVFDYHWKWLDGKYSGHGQMTLSTDDQKLAGQWWFGNAESSVSHVGYQRISSDLPSWVSQEDLEYLWAVQHIG